MSTPSTPSNPPPVVASHGHFSGDVCGAQVLLLADIGYQELVNQLEAVAAKYATTLADAENAIQTNTLQQQTAMGNQCGLPYIECYLAEGLPLTAVMQNDLQVYTTEVGVIQSTGQAATKAIDPVLTTEQNQPSALQQAANEFIQEMGTVNQGWQALANDRIG